MSMSYSSRNGDLDLGRVWAEALDVISTLVGLQAYETWFAPMQLDAIDSDKVTIECPSRFFADFVSEHHREKVAYALKKVIGTEPGVEFVSSNQSHEELINRKQNAPMPRPPRRPKPPRTFSSGLGRKLITK